jgi:VanZ like family/Concanavalin A-like lectin/glucanases superfamily
MIKQCLIGIACIAVLFIILVLGLWPFHVPKNEVTWLADRDGLRFGRFGTVFSKGEFLPAATESQSSGSIEVWLQPGRIWEFSTFLAFYTREEPFRLSLHQWQTGLLLRATQDLRVDNVFPRTGPAFLTITAGRQGTVVYVDGAVAKSAPEFQLSAKAFVGRLVLGDSPGQSDSWRGQLLGLAIYRRQLAANEVLEHFLTWTTQKRPKILEEQGKVALYLFDEHKGSIVHNNAGPGGDLYIPQEYTVLDQTFLETPWSEFRRSQGLSGVAKNILGFIPLGFCFYAYLSLVRHYQRAALITVVLGFAVSLTIEVLQAFLPTRDSGMTDLVTNTLGTYGGILTFRALMVLVRLRA